MPDSANLDVVVHDFSFKIEVNNSLITFSFLPSLWLVEICPQYLISQLFQSIVWPTSCEILQQVGLIVLSAYHLDTCFVFKFHMLEIETEKRHFNKVL